MAVDLYTVEGSECSEGAVVRVTQLSHLQNVTILPHESHNSFNCLESYCAHPLTHLWKVDDLKTAGHYFITKREIQTSWCCTVWHLLAIGAYARSFFWVCTCSKAKLNCYSSVKEYNFTLRTCTVASDNGQDDALLRSQFHWYCYLNLTFYFVSRRGAKYCDECVCLFVSLSAGISKKPHGQTSPDLLCVMTVAVACCSIGCVATRYILPALWTMSCFHIMGAKVMCMFLSSERIA